MSMKKTSKKKSFKKHKWKLCWPGNYCVECGMDDPVEKAITDNWYDPYTEKWDSLEHERYVLSCCECPGKQE